MDHILDRVYPQDRKEPRNAEGSAANSQHQWEEATASLEKRVGPGNVTVTDAGDLVRVHQGLEKSSKLTRSYICGFSSITITPDTRNITPLEEHFP